MIRTHQTSIYACTVTLLLHGETHAQLLAAQLDWQTSADDGATWLGGNRHVPSSQSSVLVRLHAAWNALPLHYFAATQFDGLIRTPGRETADQVDMYNTGIAIPWTGTFNTAGFATTRFGDTLKIDDSRDTQEPGVGSRRIMVYQIPPSFPEFPHPENPAILFTYRLALDGTPGDRLISGLFRVLVQGQPDHLSGLYISPFPGNTTFVPTTINDASVTVVPSPAACVVLAAAIALRRRRR